MTAVHRYDIIDEIRNGWWTEIKREKRREIDRMRENVETGTRGEREGERESKNRRAGGIEGVCDFT